MESDTITITDAIKSSGDNGDRELLQHNPVWLASAAMQQLPKILDALSNMARRSRNQLQKKGVFLGGIWPEKGDDTKLYPIIPAEVLSRYSYNGLHRTCCRRRGILKTSKYSPVPTLNQISSFNDFWKRFAFTYPQREMRTSRQRQSQSGFPCDYSHLHQENLQGGLLYSSGMEDPSSIDLPSLQMILMNHLKCSSLSPREQEILMQLQHLRVMFNVPIHKLLRERPKEYILPLPRRSRKSLLCSSNPHTRSLVFHQTVRILPNTDDLTIANRWFTKKVRFFGPMLSAAGQTCLSKWNRGRFSYTRTVPKGVAFLTYPDTSGDETSFEGTIGERSMISWEKGTKFPQMGVDQSVNFRCKKELSRQNMIQSRLYAARLHKRMTYRYKQQIQLQTQGDLDLETNRMKRGSFIYVPKNHVKRKRLSKSGVRRTATGHPIFRSWFKFVKIPPRGSPIRREGNGSGTTSTTDLHGLDEGTAICPEADDAAIRLQQRRRQAQRQERRKRIRIYMMKFIGFISCGLFPYIMTGECYLFKRKQRVRISDSLERCQVELNSQQSQTQLDQSSLNVVNSIDSFQTD